MKVAYLFSSYPSCNLTDLESFKRCETQDDHTVAIRMLELLFEPIQFIGIGQSEFNTNETGNDQISQLMRAVANGTADSLIAKQHLTESPAKLFSFTMPFFTTHFAIAMNRDMVEFRAVDESNYILSPFRAELWAIFGILTLICFIFTHMIANLNLKLILLNFSVFHAVLCASYSGLMKADFVDMTVPRVPYKSLESLASGLNEKKIYLFTGNSHKVVMSKMESSNKSNWQSLGKALLKRPLVDINETMQLKCDKVAKKTEKYFLMLDTFHNLRSVCKHKLKYCTTSNNFLFMFFFVLRYFYVQLNYFAIGPARLKKKLKLF